MTNIVLIAGGSGFLGKALRKKLEATAEVRVLTRDQNKKTAGYFYWDPEKGELDEAALEGVSHIINLCGSAIADKRWTAKRKQELLDSRVIPARFLFSKCAQLPTLRQYIAASGINCYDVNQTQRVYKESDVLADDFVSGLVAEWEKASDLFASVCTVLKLRISFVLAPEGGSLEKLAKPIRMGLTSNLGSGKQAIPWVQLDDLVAAVLFGMERSLAGVYHVNAGNTTNEELTRLLAKKYGRGIKLPAVPAFVLRMVLGELSVLVLEGIRATSDKLRAEGFEFTHEKLEEIIV